MTDTEKYRLKAQDAIRNGDFEFAEILLLRSIKNSFKTLLILGEEINKCKKELNQLNEFKKIFK